MKKKTLLEALLLEHVNVTGADYIGTVDDIDLFRIRTWAAAQEFVCAGTTIPAGEKWCQNESTFNRNINETTKLYFFVNRSTYAVVLGAISSNSMNRFTYQGQTYKANYILEDTSGRNTCSVDLDTLNLLPDFALEEPNTETVVQNDEENDEIETNNEIDSSEDEMITYKFLDHLGAEIEDIETEIHNLEDAINYAEENKYVYTIKEDNNKVWEKPKNPCYVACNNFNNNEGLFYISTDIFWNNHIDNWSAMLHTPEVVDRSYAFKDANMHEAYIFYDEYEANMFIEEAMWNHNDLLHTNNGRNNIQIVTKDKAIEYANKFIKRRKGFNDVGDLIDLDTEEILKDAKSWNTPDLKILIKNGEAIVVGCRNKSYDEIHIPKEYNGYPVTTIAPYAFFNINFNALYLPSTLKTIQRNAFVYTKSTDNNYRRRIYIPYTAKRYADSIDSTYRKSII